MSSNAAMSSAARPPPRAYGWLVVLIIWLLAFVVLPNGVIAVYSFGKRTGVAQVDLSREALTTANYQQIVARVPWGVFSLRAAGVSLTVILAAAVIGFAFPTRSRTRLENITRWVRRALLPALFIGISFAIAELPRGSGTYLRIFWRSIEYAAATTVICLLIGYPAAYFVARSSPRARNLLLMLILIPFWTSFLIRTYAWLTILSTGGTLNGVLLATHTISSPITTMLYTPAAVLIGLVYTYLPFMILPIYGSAEKLDGPLIEAALDLGARPMRVMRDVVWPLTLPGVRAGALAVFVQAVGMFAVSELMGGGRADTLTIGSTIRDQFIGQSGDWAFGAALGTSVLGLFVVAYLVLHRREAF